MIVMNFLVVVLALSVCGAAHAGETATANRSDLAAKSAQIEMLRVRAANAPSAATTFTLMEADNLLRQLRNAPAGKRYALHSQLEAALARLELEIDAHQHPSGLTR